MKDKGTKVFFSVLLVILIGAVVFFILNEPTVPGTYTYKDFEVQQFVDPNTGSVNYKIKMYVTNSAMNQEAVYVNTRYEPSQVENIILEGDVKESIIGKKQIYLTINPGEGLTGKTTIALLEFDKFVDNKYFFNIPVNSAVTKEFDGWLVKTCEDVDKDTSIVWFKLGDETKIYEEDGCVVVQGITEEDLIMLADGLVFKLLRVT